ncbi:homoserine kinase [Chloroflexota bacterium]
MAVKTQFTYQDFDHILTQYNQGTCTHFEPISHGTVQTNYMIHTTQGQYVFRYYENRTRESVLYESELLTYLTRHSYPCPAPIPDREGACVGTYQRKPFVIFEFIEGHHIEQPTQSHMGQLIQKVAELGILTRNYQPRFLSSRLNYDILHCRKLAQLEAEKIGTQDAFAKFAWLDSQLSALDLPDSLPKGVCHCDFHFSNILFREDQVVGLIDFDDANYTYLVFDLVNLIDYWAWPFQSDYLDLTAAREIIQTYNRQRPLDVVERHHLFDIHKLGILFDCIWFFSRGSADDFYEKRKIEYLDALGRGQYAAALVSETGN